jgi:hypothetical protein
LPLFIITSSICCHSQNTENVKVNGGILVGKKNLPVFSNAEEAAVVTDVVHFIRRCFTENGASYSSMKIGILMQYKMVCDHRSKPTSSISC